MSKNANSDRASAQAGRPIALDLQQFLPFRTHRIAAKLAASGSQLAILSGRLSLREWRVLAVVGSVGECPQRGVGLISAMDPATVSRAIAGLMRGGLIEQVASQSDGRTKLLKLTSEGESIYSELAEERMELQERMRAAFTDLEWMTLLMMLNKLDSLLEIEPI
jgi:DNA-binding MarR family transcriptional regulator